MAERQTRGIIIEGLRKKGYTFVTVSQLLGKTKPGRLYSHG